MKPIIYCQNIRELEEAKAQGLDEIILEARVLSRFGKNEMDEVVRLSREARRLGMKPVLEWDIVMTENYWQSVRPLLTKTSLSEFEAVRVQDHGALQFMRSHFPGIKLQVILETAYHNLEAILKIEELLGEQLQRLVLSTEIPKKNLFEFIKKINKPIEILGFGPLLLFYSPRALLSPIFDIEDGDHLIEVVGNSEESPHKGFKIKENIHGTFMFNPKSFCLLENIRELSENGIDILRIDLREKPKLIAKISELFSTEDPSLVEDFKSYYGDSFIQGYYRVNKSDILFKKLKNQRLIPLGEKFLGEVLEANKNSHMLVNLNQAEKILTVGDEIEIRTPEGKIKSLRVHEIMDANRKGINQASQQLVILPPISGVSIRSKVFLRSKTIR